METWTHKYEAGRSTRDGYVRVTAGLHYIEGNRAPHFSVTCEIWQSEGWYRNGQDGRCRGGGADHETILRAFPWLAPVVALHLSDENGTPMHAYKNGLYWLNQGEPDKAAKLWRCSVDDIASLSDEDEVRAYVDAQRNRWEGEADTAIDLLDAHIAKVAV